jgi:hypothetical protein
MCPQCPRIGPRAKTGSPGDILVNLFVFEGGLFVLFSSAPDFIVAPLISKYSAYYQGLMLP